jgi:hypothetical protein
MPPSSPVRNGGRERHQDVSRVGAGAPIPIIRRLGLWRLSTLSWNLDPHCSAVNTIGDISSALGAFRRDQDCTTTHLEDTSAAPAAATPRIRRGDPNPIQAGLGRRSTWVASC